MKANQQKAQDGKYVGPRMRVGLGHTGRGFCDGQSAASPGRWATSERRCATDQCWQNVSKHFLNFAAQFGIAELLPKPALGKVETCPYPEDAIKRLRQDVVADLEKIGLVLESHPDDRIDCPIN